MTEIQIKIETFQNLLLDIATGGSGDESEFQKLRTELTENEKLKKFLPDFLITIRSTGQFWQFIKFKYPTYAERRTYLWNEFAKSLNYVKLKKN